MMAPYYLGGRYKKFYPYLHNSNKILSREFKCIIAFHLIKSL
jgi:hypothetical protein